MIPSTFSDYFKSLPENARQGVIAELTSMLMTENSETLKSLAEKKQTVCCPSCGGGKISGNGKHNGVQRYVCRGCKKYFRETTGSLTHNLKKSELLSKYMYNMLLGYSIKKCANQTGISIQTSFDWRHKIISSFNELRPRTFEGIVESDDIFFLESGKGNRELDRKSRSRGSKATKRGISNEQVAVVVTQDRNGNQELAVVKKGRISKNDLDKTLGSKLEKGAILCTDAHRSYTAFAKGKEIEHHKFIANKGQRIVNQVYHVQNVNNTAKRLRTWMRPYNGVATKYLQNYLNWFMVLEKIKNNSNRLKAFAACAMASSSTYEYWSSIAQLAII
ncbi:MAG: transposase-like protein [Halioglobus sp.]|jgi:transposase-like protein